MAEEDAKKGALLKNVKGIKQLIAPGGIDITYTNHIEIISNRSKYARSMVVTSLPRTTIFPEFLRDLYNFGDINVSVFINAIPVSLSQADLNKEINTLITEIVVAQDRGDVNRARSLTIKKQEREELRDEIEAGWNSLFNASIVSTMFAYSLEELDRLTEEFSSAMGRTLLVAKPAWAMQDLAFQSNLPFNDNKINISHTFDRSSMGTVFPFFNSNIGHNTGIPLGFNRQTGVPIFFDNFSRELTNYNMVIFGKSGAGKSVTVKTLTARSAVLQGISSLALDVEGEYTALAEVLGGFNVTISPTSNTILNIFDIEPEIIKDEITGKEKMVLNVESKVEDVTQILLTMARGSTKSQEVTEVTKQIISEAVFEEYQRCGITHRVASLYKDSNIDENSLEFITKEKKDMPTIESWYHTMAKNAEMNNVSDYNFHFSYLLKVMKQYVRSLGGQLGYFDGQSTFDLQIGRAHV